MPSASLPSLPGLREGTVVARDFAFQSGERLPEIRLRWVTLGTPRRGPDGRVANAVLLLHGTTGSLEQWLAPDTAAALFGPGQPLDASRWFSILPDGLGRGRSTKPSDGLRAGFPRYGYGDVIEGHRLVVEALGVDRLRLVLGTSMGGMHAWMWAERWPERVDAILPLGCQPIAISGRNLLFRRILTESIRGDPGWEGGEYRTPPRHWLKVAPLWPAILDSPAHLQAEAPTRAAALDLYERMVERARTTWDANDLLYWLESSWDYDPEPGLDRVRAKVLAVNFADDAVNPAELPETAALVGRIPGARFVLHPAGPETNGHHTLWRAAVWKPYLALLLASLPPPER